MEFDPEDGSHNVAADASCEVEDRSASSETEDDPSKSSDTDASSGMEEDGEGSDTDAGADVTENSAPSMSMTLLFTGSSRYFQMRNEKFGMLNEAPSTITEFANYPYSDLMKVIRSTWWGDYAVPAARGVRLRDLLSNGLVLHEDFGGRRTTTTVLRMLHVAMRMAGYKLPDLEKCFICWRFCDIDPGCQHVASTSNFPAQHLFSELMDRFDQPVQKKLKRMRPCPDAKPEVKCAAYDRQKLYLSGLAKRGSVNRDNMSKCLLHPTSLCPWGWKDEANPGRPLTACFSGASCIPWTPWGGRGGKSHCDTESYNIHMIGAEGDLHDIYWLEESGGFPVVKEWQEPMEKIGYTCISLVTAPDEVGYPTTGKRVLAVATRDAVLLWLGAKTSSEFKGDFMKLFGCAPAVDGSCFAGLDTERNIREERARFLHLAPHDDRLLTAPMTDLCDDPLRERVQSNLMRANKRLGPKSKNVIIDVSQNPDARPRVGPFMPRPTRSTQPMCFNIVDQDKVGHFFTHRERAFAMGLPCLGDGGPFAHCVDMGMFELSDSKQRLLNGNAIHCGMLYKFMVFTLSQMIRKHYVNEWIFGDVPSSSGST